jgi:hypothetical protein
LAVHLAVSASARTDQNLRRWLSCGVPISAEKAAAAANVVNLPLDFWSKQQRNPNSIALRMLITSL